MENAEFNLVKPVDGLHALQPTTVDRRTRQDKRNKDQRPLHEESEPQDGQDLLEMTEPDILEGDFQGDDPHAIDYRA